MTLTTMALLAAAILAPCAIFAVPRDDGRAPRVAVAVVVFALAALGYAAFVLDRWAALTLSWTCFGSLLAIAGAISVGAFLLYRWKWVLVALTAFVAGMVWLHFANTSVLKLQQRLLLELDDGMSAAEVVSILQREVPPGQFLITSMNEEVPASGAGAIIAQIRETGPRGESGAVFIPFLNRLVILEHTPASRTSWSPLDEVLATFAAAACVICWFVVRHSLGAKDRAGKGIEVSSIIERLGRVRANYPAALPRRVKSRRRELLAAAAAAIRSLHFFQDRDAHDSARGQG